MKKCALCENSAEEKSLLCEHHNLARMLAASMDKTFRGEGLTYSNLVRFSEKNYIKMMKEKK
jgi:hypothetical protein